MHEVSGIVSSIPPLPIEDVTHGVEGEEVEERQPCGEVHVVQDGC